MMKQMIAAAALLGLVATGSTLMAGAKGTVRGQYVEARTAEVFTGGCIMGSEAGTVGKEAVLAWRIDSGSFNGVSLNGLSVVAALVGDKNLGIQEIGGGRANVKSAVYVDERANPVQRMALVAMASELSGGVMGEIVEVASAPIQFSGNSSSIQVAAGAAREITLDVNKNIPHDPSCGAMQWFHPLASVDQASIGLAATNAFMGKSLGTRWSDPNKRSAFFGTFSY